MGTLFISQVFEHVFIEHINIEVQGTQEITSHGFLWSSEHFQWVEKMNGVL